jgi:ABC-type sulfate/molybdate transport systems ATPase subunit
MTTIRLEKVSNQVLKEIDLILAEGELFVLVGPSGAGKSTLLQVIAGLVPARGHIYFNGDCIDARPPHRRRVGYLFQDLLLFPHLTVYQNLRLAMAPLKIGRREAHARIGSLLERFGILDLERRYPAQMSGGEKQRAALARAIATDPRILLLDEPFSSLDEKNARRLRGELKSHQRHFKITTLFVTHDRAEARQLADRIGVIRKGRMTVSVASRDPSDAPADAPIRDAAGDVDTSDRFSIGGPWSLEAAGQTQSYTKRG